MKPAVKLYWVFFACGCLLFALLAMLEQDQVQNTAGQHEFAYERTQQVIREKELAFVRLMLREALTDTNNLQRNWNDIIDIGKQENTLIYIFRGDTLMTWSSNIVGGDELKKAVKVTNSVIKTGNGWYLVHKQIAGTYQYYLAYRIKSSYAYKNQYIQNGFNKELHFLNEAIISLSPIPAFNDIRSVSGNYLFSLQVFSSVQKASPWVIALMIALALINLLLVHILARHYIAKHTLLTAFIFFAFFAWVRWVNTFYNLPLFLYELELFDPGIYASSIWFPSLGDLLIDSAIILWFFILLENKTPYIDRKGQRPGLHDLLFHATLCIFVAHQAYNFIKSLVIDSQISFDINDIYSIDVFTYFALIVSIILLLIVYFVCRNFTRAYRRSQRKPWHYIIYAALLGFYLLISLRLFDDSWFRFFSVMLVTLTFITFKLVIKKLNRFQQYFLVINIISAFSAIWIYKWYYNKELDNRKLFAIKQIAQNDITNDYFLRNIEKKIGSDKFIRDYFQNPIIIKSQLDKRIRQLYFTGYLSKFEVRVFDFDTSGYLFKSKNEYSYAQLNKVYEKQSLQSIAESFRYIKTIADAKGYIGKFVIADRNGRLGYLFILLQPKLIQGENRFDELLVEGYRQNQRKNFEYSYAVYNKNLVFQSGDYPYRITNTWGETDHTFRFFEENHYSHLIYTDKQPLTIIVSKPADSLSQAVGLFSFIFTFCTVMLIVLMVIYILLNAQILKRLALFNNRYLAWLRSGILKLMMIEDAEILYIRTRIQTSIIFIVFTTLIFSAYFTISFITDKYNTRQTERLMKKLRNIAITVENENLSNRNDELPEGEVEAFINQIADFYDTDISLFDAKGNLVATSIGKLYEEHVISGMMHPEAYFHLNQLKESQFAQNERIGQLSFQAAYAPVFKNKSEVIAYLQLPYFSKQADLLSEISSVVVGFINLYVLLFIIIGVIAYLVSRNISYPLVLIQQRLSRTKLGDKNEPIIWQRNDEIGELVKQYNHMIDQLEESARKLAETERQGAWRDIAKQIAHEIKNPLTPMKLSIQHLQRAWANNDANMDDKLKRTTSLLVAQIDTLSELANEFSSYAKMPAPSYEEMELCEALKQIVDLYSLGNEHHITLSCSAPVTIVFDRSYLSRIVGNLVKNAIQAMADEQTGLIEVSATADTEMVTIVVKDNGSGMSDLQASKIFTPYFSTKISGMGLGLPIVKNMIESSGGHITFTTVEGVGTVFTVTLPKQQIQ